MRASGVQHPVSIGNAVATEGPGRIGLEAKSLCDLAAGGLVPMFDGERGLFCNRVRLRSSGLVREGLSERYTIISLLGLGRAEAAGRRSEIDIQTVLGGLLEETTWIGNLGDLGLLLWLCALERPERLEQIIVRLDLPNALSRFPDGRERRTMELAWFLSGIAHAALVLPAIRLNLADPAVKVYGLLTKNQGDSGIFGHLAARNSVAGILRGRAGSFADQAYPIYALAQFANAYEERSALQAARKCADAICETQGSLGQWWWHYDAPTGRVLQRYPVYAVHQDGMAPLALFALGDATRTNFNAHIYAGLSWIKGRNELRRDLRDTSAGVIWRSICRPAGWKARCHELREFVRPGRAAGQADDLKVLHECRPYHLGWLLYAFAGRDCGRPVA